MALGPFIRKRLGKYERPISDAYRNFFFNINEMGNMIKRKVPNVENILEVGCGEGVIVEVLNKVYPHAEIYGIDIIQDVGRQFIGDAERVKFEKISIEDFNKQYKRKFACICRRCVSSCA